MSVFLSAVLGGTELEQQPAIKQSFEYLHALVPLQPEMVDNTDVSVQIVFHYPGRVTQPDFTGIKIGAFSKKRNMLLISVAVPAEMLASKDFLEYYHNTLRQCVTIASQRLQRKALQFSLQDHLQLLERAYQNASVA